MIERWEDEKREGEGGEMGNSVTVYFHFNFFALSDKIDRAVTIISILKNYFSFSYISWLV